jgi:hypothetical protein
MASRIDIAGGFMVEGLGEIAIEMREAYIQASET